MADLILPEHVRSRLQLLGDAGQAWHDELPSVVDGLARGWRFTVGEVLEGGSEALVARVERADGRPAILKIGVPGADVVVEAQILRLAGGRGYAECYELDADTNAMLLEHLGPSLASLVTEPDERLARAVATLEAARVPLSEPGSLTPLDNKARGLAELIQRLWPQLERPCAERTVELALDYAARRAAAHTDVVARGEAVLVHGDAHDDNMLRAGEGVYKLVDPDGLFGEAAYDYGVLLREDDTADTRVDALAERTGVDRDAIWQWAFVERVSTGLHALEIGGSLVELGRGMLAVADRYASDSV